jgi:DNA-binding transcriptional MerR regulator
MLRHCHRCHVKADPRDLRVKIGELARRTGIPPRLLRYYEQQRLLVPNRSPNGYRDYPEGCVARAEQIRSLLDYGLPMRLIKQIVPLLRDACVVHVADPPAHLIDELQQERDRVDRLVRCLAKNRDGIDTYLAAIRPTSTRRNDMAPPR